MADVLHPDDFDDSPEALERLHEVLTRPRQDPDALLRDLRQLLTVKPGARSGAGAPAACRVAGAPLWALMDASRKKGK